MAWGWPQFVVAGLLVADLGLAIGRDGAPRTGTESFGSSLVAAAIWAWLLYMGAFWTPSP